MSGGIKENEMRTSTGSGSNIIPNVNSISKDRNDSYSNTPSEVITSTSTRVTATVTATVTSTVTTTPTPAPTTTSTPSTTHSNSSTNISKTDTTDNTTDKTAPNNSDISKTSSSTISSNPTASNTPTNPTTDNTNSNTSTLYEIRRPPPLRLVPPLNFALAERQLYRSGQPAPINFPFLRQLNLKTIVWLAVEDPSDAFLGFADNNEIEFHHLGLVTEGGNPWDQLTESSIVTALDIIMNVKSYPLLVCCGMGRHRTGTVIGCLRRLQGWNFASISDEYRRFVGAKGGRVLIELHIEAFDTKSVHINLDSAPSWIKQPLSITAPSTTCT